MDFDRVFGDRRFDLSLHRAARRSEYCRRPRIAAHAYARRLQSETRHAGGAAGRHVRFRVSRCDAPRGRPRRRAGHPGLRDAHGARERPRRALPGRPRRNGLRRRLACRRHRRTRGLAIRRTALALLQASRAAARDCRARSRSSNGTARIAIAGAAGRRRSTSPASAPSNVRRADTSFIRACRRR